MGKGSVQIYGIHGRSPSGAVFFYIGCPCHNHQIQVLILNGTVYRGDISSHISYIICITRGVDAVTDL